MDTKYKRLINMSNEIENAPNLFTDNFEQYMEVACGGGSCGGKCYGGGGAGPSNPETPNSGLAKKIVELLKK